MQICAACERALEQRSTREGLPTFGDLVSMVVLIVFFGGLSMVAYRSASLEGMPVILQYLCFGLSGVCALVAVLCMMGLGFLLFVLIRDGIIGWYVYRFRTEDGALHDHLERPISMEKHWFSDVDAYVLAASLHNRTGGQRSDGSEYRIQGPIVRLPHGSWWKRGAILTEVHDRQWRIVGAEGDLVTVAARATLWQLRGYFRGPTRGDLLDLIDEFSGVQELYERCRAAEELRDYFGIGVTLARLRIEAARDTIGRSKHGKYLKGLLDRLLEPRMIAPQGMLFRALTALHYQLDRHRKPWEVEAQRTLDAELAQDGAGEHVAAPGVEEEPSAPPPGSS